MKFYTALLALCVVQTTAFSVQGSKGCTYKGSINAASLLTAGASSGSEEYDSAVEASDNTGTPAASSYEEAMQKASVAAGTSAASSYEEAMKKASASASKDNRSSVFTEKAWNSAKHSTHTASMQKAMEHAKTKNIWDSATPIVVQGGSLRTCSFPSQSVKRVKVSLRTNGRPLNANVDLWQGPDNAPQKMSVYIEDGSERPFSAVIATPRGQNAVAVRNTGNMEFPLSAAVEADVENAAWDDIQALSDMSIPEAIQGGGTLKTYSFEPAVSSLQILLETDGRPLNARIELLQGPNNNKQVIELYAEDGRERPFYAVLETPGVGNVVRIVNTAPVEFPMTARVEPYTVEVENENGGWA